MNRIAEIIALCKEKDGQQADLERRAELENQGQFTADMRAAYDKLDAEVEALIEEKKSLEADAAKKANRAIRAADLEPAVLPRRVAPTAAAPAPQTQTTTLTPVDAHSPGNGPPTTETVRFNVPIRALRGGAPRNFRDVVNGMQPAERAYRFGMWAMSRIGTCMPQYLIPSAVNFVNNYMGGVYNTAHGSSDGTTGGHFLVPEEFDSDMIVLRETYGVARRLFARSVMSSDTKHEPKRNSGLTAYFVNENDTATESNMTWSDVQLIAKDIVAMSRLSAQLNADAAIAVGDALAGEISYAFANKEDECAFNGDGSQTYGGIQGIRNGLVNTDGANTASAGAVTQGTSNTWSAMVLGDFNNVVGKLPQYADTNNTVWVCHKTFYASVMQKLETAAGGNSLRDISMGDRAKRPLFLGYPVEFSQVFPSVTATTGIMCVLGDLQLSSIFGDRQQTSITFSESATIGGQSVFERCQIAVRGTERFDINNHGCGTSATVGAVVGLRTA